MMKLLVLSCVLLASHAWTQETPVVLCGRQLANARVLLCYGAEYATKRSDNDLTNVKTEDNWWEEGWPWKSRKDALSALSRYKRGGLVSECCLKACTRSEILNYC